MLSRAAQLFDPLGWITPVIVLAKILIQRTWRHDLAWDDEVPQDIAQSWMTPEADFRSVEPFRLPRWVGLISCGQAVELHGFSDASFDALGAVVYLRLLNDDNSIVVSLLCAKSKVAPLRKTTIPRLELSAAVLLARLVHQIRDVFTRWTPAIHLWTDSTVALTWINGHPSRWKEFVANRVQAIRDLVPDGRWHHTPGSDNPADCASRGVLPTSLRDHSLWWTGPSWLQHHSTRWPASAPLLDPDIDLEIRSPTVTAVTALVIQDEPWDLIHRFSRLSTLLKVTAWVLRAINRMRKLSFTQSASLTPSEIHTTELFWIQCTQAAHFRKELSHLSQSLPLSTSSPLIRLSPFIDGDGVLRVGGRLKNAHLSFDATHQFILPKHSLFTYFVIVESHEKSFHGGTQLTLALLRRKFWILGGRSPVRDFVRRCVHCIRYRGSTAEEMMGHLPAARVTPARPFLHSGVDYAGPFTLKAWNRRGARPYKAYLVVFICLATSAIHLELATDYSTQGFIAAFQRFVSRRGICASLTSDCGTNFIGADAELRRMFDSASSEARELAHLLAKDGTAWNFNPPAAPHFGGKWEAAVKSVKHHLRRTIGETRLTYEDFSTLLAQIEAVLNSRPLGALSDDTADLEAFTPGHFLIGAPLTAVPAPTLSHVPTHRLSRLQHVRQMFEHFWRR